MSYANPAPRKILHVDMDAFYASVEQRDDAALRGKPVVVAWRGARSVVVAASYEARVFGVRSAMPAVRAERLCPDAIFIPPDFTRYRAASKQVRDIFLSHTDLVEPLSLDEAYLDVTQNKQGFETATAVAKAIRAEIRVATALTASAGVAPVKFLAKIASEVRKPDGLFVIQPHQVLDFLAELSVSKIPGVGKVMQARLAEFGVERVGDLRRYPMEQLEQRFGRYGRRLSELAIGIDRSEVKPDRPTRSISSEDTFSDDKLLHELHGKIRELALKTWNATSKTQRIGHTVVLKLKTAQFRIITRSFTPECAPQSQATFTDIALALLDRVELSPTTRYRLAGVGLSGFREADEISQRELFPTPLPSSISES